MAITDILAAAQGGRYFATAGAACGLDETAARRAISKFAPAIATKLKNKAAADPEAFDALLDILEDGGDSSDLDDVEAMTGAEAQSDGAAILDDLYGSQPAAVRALGASGAAEEKAAALSATGVLAALAASHAATLTSDVAKVSDSGAGGGFFSILIAALLKGLMQGAARQIAPPRRRRRYTTTTRRRTTRRRTRRPGLDQIFADILTGRK
jgi:hypothetical protein